MHVVSPEVVDTIDELAGSGRVTVSERPFASEDLLQRDLVVAATGDTAVDAQIRDESARAGVLCNVASDADSCDVVFPSSVRRGPLVVAISTGGSSPALAARARDLVENALGPEWGELAELLESSRDRFRAVVPDAGGRRAAVDRLVEAGALDLLAAGRRDEAVRLVDDIVGGS